MIYLSLSIALLYQRYKNGHDKIQVGLLFNHHNINISKHHFLPKEIDHPRKRFINIEKTDDDECFK